ncbi:Protein transport protein sec22 [Cladobotryum mycophilum]|uniref:Protein transport protein SEC22 n=1 Tax=Cladobotryum mycophilum TaxID=491253 RepID=A0ABR0SPL2_9HYPO
MTPTTNTHKRSHSLLLLQKLLNLRDAASPLTLLLDTLEQTARPVVSELTTRAKIAKTKVIFLSFSTLRKPQDVDVFIKAAGRDLNSVRRELLANYPAFQPTAAKDKTAQRAVVIIDSLNSLASSASQSLAMFLSGMITPVVSVVAVYHTDVPVILPKTFSEYEPHPFALLCHLATAILRLSSLQQEIERQKARNRSVQEPEWGLKEDREGVLIGITEKSKPEDQGGVVINMELRRRSGRTISEKFILMPAVTTPKGPGKLGMLTDHSMFARLDAEKDGEGEGEPESTFNLGLTEKQRKDREGIVLPYFDAQTDIGAVAKRQGNFIPPNPRILEDSTTFSSTFRNIPFFSTTTENEQDDSLNANIEARWPHALRFRRRRSTVRRPLTEVKNQVRQILRKLTRNSEAQASIESGGPFTLHYLIDSDVIFLCICERSYPRKLAFTYLADLAREFTTTYTAQNIHNPSLRPYAFMEFDNFIAKTRTTYADSRASQNLDKLNDELRDVTKIMTKNIEDLLYRGDNLERMGDISSRLREDSKKYKRAAVRINWELLLKQYGPFAGLGFFILIFLYWRFF